MVLTTAATATDIHDITNHYVYHCSGRPQRLLFSATFPLEVLELAKRAIPKPINEITLASNEELMLEEIYQCWIDLRHDGAQGRVNLLSVSTDYHILLLLSQFCCCYSCYWCHCSRCGYCFVLFARHACVAVMDSVVQQFAVSMATYLSSYSTAHGSMYADNV
jgi:hypothetical protein